ncbi:peptide/nickel transport system ATP-binding protein [Devosia psychrophila]|jgi:oligopeptide/dipeptide ABC transporter ATP-binding protein|uniref:Peptide/nickel transport system ATP-binding protein n=2 Tax=Devosia psychrophila TaxID=728005 RepID=A0A1I1N977_9HYPH|nr:ABC transporter ATP-binding protein [Devosia psychrophila]SFC94015.1 peptide/nickel transport system ATP-binding protein [Devosia psychrophila]
MPLIPMGDKPILSISDMSIVFSSPDEADIEAVRQVDLTLTPGKTLALVGESGCGKSVTARAVLRLLDKNADIQRGSIIFAPGDAEATDIVQLRQDSLPLRAIRGNQISMIFQEPMSSLSPVHTIGDQIDEMMVIHEGLKPKQARERTVALLDQVGIPGARERADAYPFQLSGGLRQRAMIAMALACTPKVLIADEPTTALDVTTQAQILDLLRQLQADFGMAMLFITHDLGVVAEIADEVAVMYLGDVVEQGSVFDVFAAPKHPYTQALMSSIPKMARKADRVRLSPIKGTVPAPRDRPQGCAFTSRCPYAFEPCATIRPERTAIGDNHHARCHLLTRQPAEAAA